MNGTTYTPRPIEEAAARLQETLGMALLIADEAARSDIEQFGRPDYSVQREKGHTDWYFIGAGEAEDAYEASALIRAAKYLTLRDKLETDPADIQRVRIKA